MRFLFGAKRALFILALCAGSFDLSGCSTLHLETRTGPIDQHRHARERGIQIQFVKEIH